MIIGVNGQDGSLLAENLLARGRRVIGVGRCPEPTPPTSVDFSYLRLDLRDEHALADALMRYKPSRIFHLAAVHGPDGAPLETQWADALRVNVMSLQACLEHARLCGESVRVIYASSSRIFGTPLRGRLDEDSPYAPTDLYGVTKKMACDLIALYRTRHGADAAAIHFFNHDSDRRPSTYFSPKLTAAVAAALHNQEAAPIRSLDFHCDWGDAAEYMDLVARFSEADAVADCILATGRTWSGQELAEAVFRRFDLDWRDYLDAPRGPAREAPFTADVSTFERMADARPRRSILDVCDDLIRKRIA
ncbi:MAG: GDP-mannose 4,6-dehydratase [Pseudomonadota bacterium]